MKSFYKVAYITLALALTAGLTYRHYLSPRYTKGSCVIFYTNPDKNVTLQFSNERPYLVVKIKDIDEEKRRYLAETFINSRVSSEQWTDFDSIYDLGVGEKTLCSNAISLLAKTYHDE